MNLPKSKLVFGAGISTTLFVIGLMSLGAPKSIASKTQGPRQDQIVEIGRKLFFDNTLSDPTGMSCSSCHSPAAGFSFGNSDVNLATGPVEGVVPGRFGFRKPPTAAYSTYLPVGIPYYDATVGAYVGGLFYDGRVENTVQQAEQPFLNPNEMDNLVHNLGSPEMVVSKVEYGPSGNLFRAVYGQNVFRQPVSTVYPLIAESISAFEASPEVAPFSSKYDAWLAGKATLTPTEMDGLRLATGRVNGRKNGAVNYYNAHCSECHGITADPTIGPDLWTFSCYANLGIPKNPDNPYYGMTNQVADPAGFNPAGKNYIDLGLGDFLYPHMGLPAGDPAENDPLAIDGTFKTPTLRNVGAKPYPSFVKCYMHNGVFKTLQQVVHFYNTRNLTTYPGEVIDFTKPNPYAHLKGTPLWPKPEWPSAVSMINPQGASNATETVGAMGNEQIGNMGMTPEMEAQLVAFLGTLTDGYYDP